MQGHGCRLRSLLLTSLLAVRVCIRAAAQSAPPCTPEARTLPANGTMYADVLESGCQMQIAIAPGAACNETAFLHLEVWDLSSTYSSGLEDGLNYSSSSSSTIARADPLLGMASGMLPNATYGGTASAWTITPPYAVFDTKGYELSRPYMHVQSAYNATAPWFVSLQNLNQWTNCRLEFQIRATCAQQPMCPAPVLSSQTAPVACSGKGACQGDGSCVCDPGSGDVGCGAKTPVLPPGSEEQHTLSSADWMYWQLEVTQDGAAITVQLNRTSGDPVLFLKPSDLGFQVGIISPLTEVLYSLQRVDHASRGMQWLLSKNPPVTCSSAMLSYSMMTCLLAAGRPASSAGLCKLC